MGIQLRNENVALFGHYFKLPIHPLLVEPEKSYDAKLAVESFGKAFSLWKDAFPKIIAKLPKREQEDYENAFGGRKALTKNKRGYEVRRFGWQSRLGREANGFSSSLCLDMNCSCIGIDKSTGRWNHEMFLSPEYNGIFGLSNTLEDTLFFSVGHNEHRIPPHDKLASVMVPCYSGHNIDNHGTSLMLRLWGIDYLNTLMGKLKL